MPRRTEDPYRRSQVWRAWIPQVSWEPKRVLVVSDNEQNRNPRWNSVICVYVSLNASPGAGFVRLGSLESQPLADCNTILTLAKADMIEPAGPPIGPQDTVAVYHGIAQALGAIPIYRRLFADGN